MRYSAIVLSQRDLPSKGQNDILQRIPGHFRAEVELQVRKQKLCVFGFFLLKLLIDFVAFVLLTLGGLYFGELVALVGGVVDFDGRVDEVEAGVEFEVDEFEQHGVEVQEGDHDPVVHVDGQVGRVLEGDDVGDLLPENLALVVNSFDANKRFPQSMRADHVKFEVLKQFGAELNFVTSEVELLVRGEDGEEGHEGEGVVEVSQRIDELGVPLSDQVAEGQLRLVLGQVSDFADISLGLRFFVFFEINFLPTDFLDQRVKRHEVYVLEVVVAATGLLEFLGGFAGIDALEDAELPEVLEGEL